MTLLSLLSLSGLYQAQMLKLFRMLKMVLQLRARLDEILNVPRGYASGFLSPAALLRDHFEHPPSKTHCKWSNVEILFDADVPLAGVAENGDDVFPRSKLFGDLLRSEDVGAGGDADQQPFFLRQ